MEIINGVTYPKYQDVRDNIVGQTTVFNNEAVETAILTGSTGFFRDVCMITGTNGSGLAITATVRNKTAAGDVVMDLKFAASTTTTYQFDPPLKGLSGQSWTLAMVTNANSNTVVKYYVQGVKIADGVATPTNTITQ